MVTAEPPVAVEWAPLCMTAEEWAMWRELNPLGLSFRELAMRPCEDCPASYAMEMRAIECCNGEPGA